MAQEGSQTQPYLHVTVLAPEKTLYSGDAQALTCHNEEGEFDILPWHGNFVSLIDEYVVIHVTKEKRYKIPIGRALLKSSKDAITILLNIDLSERDILFKALFQQLEDQNKASENKKP